MKIAALTQSREKGKPREQLDSALLVADHGMQGDRFAGAGDKQVSLVDVGAFENIKNKGGLCLNKFDANIRTHGLNYAALKPHDIIKLGDCEIEITHVGKECYDACGIFKEGSQCPLPHSCAFGAVRVGGTVQTNMGIAIK